MNKQGFTLVELALVLGIIGILTHLAVRELSQWRKAQLHRESEKGLDEIRVAVLGSDFERNSEGVRVRNGFLSDMGRLPQVYTNHLGRLSLIELWHCADEDHYFAARAAVAANLSEDSNSADADPDVMLAGGWRGPYIRLKQGSNRLTDCWGNGYETPDDAHFTWRLRGPDNQELDQEGETVAIIRHLGADGQPDELRTPNRSADQDMALHLLEVYGADRTTNATLSVTVNGFGSDGDPSSGSFTAIARVYQPLGDKIQAISRTFTLSSGFGHVMIKGLTPGERILRITCNGQKTQPHKVVIHPGNNTLTERMRVE